MKDFWNVLSEQGYDYPLDMKVDWDEYFMGLAYMASMKSKDKGAKTGAIIVDDDHIPVMTGFNGLAKGLIETAERSVKPLKLKVTSCAERSAILFAARKGKAVEGTTIYTQWCPCNECAIAIIQSGIKKVVVHKENIPSESWNDEFEFSKELLAEADVEYVEWSGNILIPRAFKGDEWKNL